MDIAILKEKFIQIYGAGEIRTFFSPSRVNLIGEHIDYNGGYVMPCAIELGTYGCVRKRNDEKIRLASLNFDLQVEVDLNNLEYLEDDGWANYPKGVMDIFKKSGYKISGMDILVSGNIPNGAGLSSSASLETLIAMMINNLFNDGSISKIDMIKACQKAENEFIGVKCGIMDQFAVCMGAKNKAILLDCDSLEYHYTDVKLGNYTLVIMNTNKRRELNQSKYNEIRAECEETLKILKEYKDINGICQLTPEEYSKLEKHIKNDNFKNRARHAVFENERVLKTYDNLAKGNVEEVGKLLVESHNSLKNLYKVTGKELDTIVEASLEYEKCIGARMTGAGFGGCAIALVQKDSVDDFMNEVGKKYRDIVGYEADFYITGIGEGTREVSDEEELL